MRELILMKKFMLNLALLILYTIYMVLVFTTKLEVATGPTSLTFHFSYLPQMLFTIFYILRIIVSILFSYHLFIVGGKVFWALQLLVVKSLAFLRRLLSRKKKKK